MPFLLLFLKWKKEKTTKKRVDCIYSFITGPTTVELQTNHHSFASIDSRPIQGPERSGPHNKIIKKTRYNLPQNCRAYGWKLYHRTES